MENDRLARGFVSKDRKHTLARQNNKQRVVEENKPVTDQLILKTGTRLDIH